MASAAQVLANRENAKKSRGPVTEEGKQTSSRNNFRHGLTGHGFVFIESEAPEYYDALLQALQSEYAPSTPSESLLVEKMAQHTWLARRAVDLETLQMHHCPFDDDSVKRAMNYARYAALHERLVKSILADLLKLRSEKKKGEIGFESQTRSQAQELRKAERHSIDMKSEKLVSRTPNSVQLPRNHQIRTSQGGEKESLTAAVAA
jgi:hypothetical protein